jgi:hypothetical protein
MLLFSSFNLSSKPWVNSSIHANATLRLGGASFSHFSRKNAGAKRVLPPHIWG